jgi:actin-related protein 8
MVGKKSGKALREEGMIYPAVFCSAIKGSAGLERTDNNMELTTWPVVNMINQKNYYTLVALGTPGHLPLAI